MTIEVGQTYKDGVGTEYTITRVDTHGGDYSVIADNSENGTRSYNLDGTFLSGSTGIADLILVPEATPMNEDDRLEPYDTIAEATVPVETIQYLSMGQAILLLKSGARVQRAGWNGKGQYLELQVPDEHSKMRHPYIYISPVDGKFVPWLASQTDILADDWMVYNA